MMLKKCTDIQTLNKTTHYCLLVGSTTGITKNITDTSYRININ